MSPKPTKTTNDAGQRARGALFASAGLTLALYYIPFGHTIGLPLLWLSTWAHELGHGVAATLVGGHCKALHLYFDGSGTAPYTAAVGHVATAFIMAGGLCGPAVAAAVLFLLARRARVARLGLFVFALTLIASDVFLVRTLFGVIFVGAFGAILLIAAWRVAADTAQTIVAFLAVQLALSVFSDADYLFTDIAHTGDGVLPSDVAQMATALGGPYWLWGLACGAFSIAVLALGLWLFVRRARSTRRAQSR